MDPLYIAVDVDGISNPGGRDGADNDPNGLGSSNPGGAFSLARLTGARFVALVGEVEIVFRVDVTEAQPTVEGSAGEEVAVAPFDRTVLSPATPASDANLLVVVSARVGVFCCRNEVEGRSSVGLMGGLRRGDAAEVCGRLVDEFKILEGVIGFVEARLGRELEDMLGED